MLNSITVKDIQVQNVRSDSNPNNDNKIRKSWVLQLPESMQNRIKEKYKHQEVRFALYQSIDNAVSDKWIEIMRKHFDDAIAQGSKIRLGQYGKEYLEDQFCTDADEQLIEAATIVMYELIDDLTPNKQELEVA